MTKRTDDEAWAETLRTNYSAQTPVTGEVMRQPPNGPVKTLEQMISDQDALQASRTVPAVITAASAPIEDPETVVHDIPVHLVVDSPYQPRVKYDEAALIVLGHMLQDRGQDEPIVVRQLPDGKMQLISGHRRIRAARIIGWATIKGRVRILDDRQAQIATLTANEGREDLSDYERAKSYQIALAEGLARSQSDVGRMFGRTQARVSQCMQLLKLPAPVLSLLDDYPSLIGYRFVAVIDELIVAYPNAGDTIKTVLLNLIDKTDLTPDDVRASALKELRIKPKVVKPKNDQFDVQNDDGAKVFHVKHNTEKKEIVIQWAPEFGDFELTSKKIMANLRDVAKKTKLQ